MNKYDCARVLLNVRRLGRVAQRVGLNVNEFFDSFGLCCECMCVCGVSVTARHFFHSFPSINNSVSTTEMLASLNVK